MGCWTDRAPWDRTVPRPAGRPAVAPPLPRGPGWGGGHGGGGAMSLRMEGDTVELREKAS